MSRLRRSAFCCICAAYLRGCFWRADGVTFNSPTGIIASPHTYTLAGFSIIATAFTGGSLFGKNDGIAEQ